MTAEKIESTPEAWEDGLLGADEAFVAVAENVDRAVESIRHPERFPLVSRIGA